MTKVVVDPAFGAKITGLTGAVELCDESGRTLGYFHPLVRLTDSSSGKIESPIPKEEIERRRQEKGGRTLPEILADLNRQ